MVILSLYLSIIKGKWFNTPIKKHKVAEWIKKEKKDQLYAAYKRLT